MLSAGFAKQIAKHVGADAVQNLRDTIKELKLNIGRIINMSDPPTNNTIVNLITKPYSKHPPCSTTVMKECLQRLNNIGYDEIDMPLIGCGRDKLDWNDVLTLITRTMSCKINIHVDNNDLYKEIQARWDPQTD